MLYPVHLACAGFELTTLVMACISSSKSNYHTITTTMPPHCTGQHEGTPHKTQGDIRLFSLCCLVLYTLIVKVNIGNDLPHLWFKLHACNWLQSNWATATIMLKASNRNRSLFYIYVCIDEIIYMLIQKQLHSSVWQSFRMGLVIYCLVHSKENHLL